MSNIGSLDPSNSERLYNAGRFSRTRELAATSGPVSKPRTIGTAGAPVKGAPRGILKQMNVGDLNSVVDDLTKKTAALISSKGGAIDSSA